jgi:hypothetical protein
MKNVLSRSANIKEVDRGVKNEFNWKWLEETDENGDFLSDYVRKINQPGRAFCTWCNDTLKYGSSGKRDLK